MERTVAAWLGPEQVGLFKAAARAAELSVVAAGSPAKGQSAGVADELGGSPIDDLRAMLTRCEVRLIVIAAPEAFGAGPSPEDAVAIRAAQQRGVKIAALEPIPAAALDLAGAWTEPSPPPVDAIRFVPLLRHSGSFRAATEVLAQFGHIRTVLVESWSHSSEGSLGARMYSALHLVHSLLGEPETIDASFVGPGHGKGVHVLPGESLRGLTGDMTANLRFADGRAAGIAASDQASRWNRTVTLLGPGGRLRVFDDGFEWIGQQGSKTDESRNPDRKRGTEPKVPLAVAALAESLARLLDPGVPDPGPCDHATILAMGQAALLSARTGQAESPATIKHMAGAV